MNAPGRLHNLSQEIHSGQQNKETWFAYSSHTVILAASVVERRSASVSQSVTPSPHKKRKVLKPKLQNWTVRLCQIIEVDGPKTNNKKAKTDDSETESDEELNTEPSFLTAWYSAQFNLAQSLALLKESGETTWETLELRIRVAWDNGCIDVMGAESLRAVEGDYPSVKLVFTSSEIEGEEENASQTGKVDLLLHRLKGVEELQAASIVSRDLAKAYNTLKSQTESLKQERDGHRKLLQNNRRHERFKEANSSLVNPGRLKRKTLDDEGFEGDEDDEES